MTERRLYWEVVNIIEKNINDGNYVIGSRLPPERILSKEYGVSRPTILQALIALEVMGKVEARLNSGF